MSSPRKGRLRDRAKALRGHADGGAVDYGLGERRIQHALGAEAVQKPVGRPKHAAVDPDVLAKNDNVGILPLARPSAMLIAPSRITSRQAFSRSSSFARCAASACGRVS